MPTTKQIVGDTKERIPAGDRPISRFELFAQIVLGHLDSPTIPAPNNREGLLKLALEITEFYRPFLRDSYSAEPGMAIRDHDEKNPGQHVIIFRTLEGKESVYRGLVSDEAVPEPTQTRSDPWATLRDASAAPVNRADALAELLRSSRATEAIKFLADELAFEDLSADWRDVLVFAAESVHFPPDLRSMVGDRLLDIAAKLRREPEGRDTIVWCALRRGASLLPPDRIERLLPFLDAGGSVETRSVALKCIVRVFEPAPPPAVPVRISDRANAFATKLLDPDVFTPGDVSVAARNAVAALAAIGDARLNQAVEKVIALARPFLIRRVRDELARLRSAWRDRSVAAEHPAAINLDQAIAKLG
ncbi:MAG TPA: hypothetical protein VK395_28405 [Gemmataceae bacterium]|nr:hypothetical protein [Gemmataceae bacterium]